jgi:RimJ/RimL family protein N-acetyltransferase
MLPDRIDAGTVALRWLTPGDATAVQRHCADARVALATAVIPHPYPDGAAATWIAAMPAARNAGDEYVWAIVPRGARELAGVIGLHLARSPVDNVGYWVGVPHWGRGYATAALSAVITAAFERLPLDAVRATHLARNPASGRVMEKCGMALVATELRAHRGGDAEPYCVRAIERARWASA